MPDDDLQECWNDVNPRWPKPDIVCDCEGVYCTCRSHEVTVQGTSKVTIPGAIQFHQNGVVVAQLDAVYDFADLAPDLHQVALEMIYRHQVLCLPNTRERDVELTQPEVEVSGRSRWRRWLRI